VAQGLREEDEASEGIHFQAGMMADRRSYGTGYYSFSANDSERSEQMAQLKQLRTDTLQQRGKREQLKRKRTELQAARIAKIKQRRLGLPGGL
jgi:hypothetical protein